MSKVSKLNILIEATETEKNICNKFAKPYTYSESIVSKYTKDFNSSVQWKIISGKNWNCEGIFLLGFEYTPFIFSNVSIIKLIEAKHAK